MSDYLREPVEVDAALARRNVRFAWALVGLFILLAGGTTLVAYAYLWLS